MSDSRGGVPVWVALIGLVGTIFTSVLSAWVTVRVRGTRAVENAAAREVSALSGASAPPIGSILPYLGDPEDLVVNASNQVWVLCDGRTIPDNSGFRSDADSEGGRQVPDLRGMFLRGSESAGAINGALEGGSDAIAIASHHHQWSAVSGKHWATFDSAGQRMKPFAAWSDGIGNEGTGHYPLSTASEMAESFFTSLAGDGRHDNRPRFTAVHFICRIN